MAETVIFSKEELNILFNNKIQREIFIDGMTRLIDLIECRTVHTPFIKLNQIGDCDV